MKYTNENRGTIQCLSRLKQVIDFNGLRYGTITPSDIDGVYEINRLGAYVFYEFKLENADLPVGQRLLLERLVNDLTFAGNYVAAILLRHNVRDPNESVIAMECRVDAYYKSYSHTWMSPKKPCLCKEFTDSFFKYVERERAKEIERSRFDNLLPWG